MELVYKEDTQEKEERSNYKGKNIPMHNTDSNQGHTNSRPSLEAVQTKNREESTEVLKSSNHKLLEQSPRQCCSSTKHQDI